MTRVFSLFSILAALAIGGYLFTAQAGSEAKTRRTSASEVNQAEVTGATANFAQAGVALDAQHIATGSYAGTNLGGYGGVVLVSADANTYCIQVASGTAVYHQAGPGTGPVAGPC
jgi:hypothetical protein